MGSIACCVTSGSFQPQSSIIINVYNEVVTALLQLAESLGAMNPQDGTVVLENFNIHHPLWLPAPRRTGNGRGA
ncbi:hypothetical protein B0T11DRAFT_289246 [Plectosphaerella cucumerina]|uniref:Uncharacterized protein n=1 Tax=Plectosphaerella cucumerina TaxID=40658 RepID=A0A8K0WZR3_9PEZI|nr:hypothetical protein B0T11DRAFT_289246 [Plectosphaerella cucumerina]